MKTPHTRPPTPLEEAWLRCDYVLWNMMTPDAYAVMEWFRLNDVDTPEIFRPKSRAESEHGYEATEFVKSLILNAVITLRTYKDVGIYGRYSAEVIFDDGSSLAALLKEQGFEKKEEY